MNPIPPSLVKGDSDLCADSGLAAIKQNREQSRAASTRQRTTFLLIAVILSFIPLSSHAEVAAEHDLKSAYLFRFIEYVTWPGDPGTNAVVIGFHDYEPYRETIAKHLPDVRSGDRPVVFRGVESIDDARACDILFVNTNNRQTLSDYLEAVSGFPVLVVTDIKSGARLGAAISFFTTDGKIRFVINQTAAEKANLTISSRLLRLGRIVNGTSTKEDKP